MASRVSDLFIVLLVLSGAICIVGFTIAGYGWIPDFVGIFLGFIVGCISSLVPLGLAATLYDIQDKLRILVENVHAQKAR